MKRIIFFILLMSTGLVFGDEIRCSVSDGKATALYCTDSSGSMSGKISITAFNENGSRTNSSFCIGVGVAVMGCSELCSINVSEDSMYCDAIAD